MPKNNFAYSENDDGSGVIFLIYIKFRSNLEASRGCSHPEEL